MVRWRRLLGVLSCLTCSPLLALANPPLATTSGKVPGQAHQEVSALMLLAQGVAQVPINEPSLVVLGPLKQQPANDTPALDAQAQASLHEAILRVVGSAVGNARIREKRALSLEEARRLSRRKHLPLVYLDPSLAGGFLTLQVELVLWPRGFWQQALNPEGSVTESRSFRVKADAGIRRHLPPAKGLFSQKKSFKGPLLTPVALSCGDLDQDGGNDLVVLGRREVTWGRFAGDHFQKESVAPLSTLSPISPAPLRAPLAGALIGPEGLLIGSSDRREGLLLDKELRLVRRMSPRFPLPNGDCLSFNEQGLDAQRQDCGEKTLSHSIKVGLDAMARATLTEADGTVTTVQATVENGASSASIVVERAASPTLRLQLEDVGSVIAWADLDGDGSIELISSRSVNDPKEDGLLVHSLKGDKLLKKKHLKMGPVQALTVCPFTGRNPLTVVAAVGNDLWALY